MKKTIFIILIVTLFVSQASAYSIVGFDNFKKNDSYSNGRFEDVADSDWFAKSVSEIYEYSLMQGTSDYCFSPQTNITIAQTLTIASNIWNIYHCGENLYIGDANDFKNWYDPFVESAIDFRIIGSDDYDDFNVQATRAQFADILSRSIDSIGFEAVNLVDDGAIPDVPMDAYYAEPVYMMYRAGIFAGVDSKGSFNPNALITRAEAAAILIRIIDPSMRGSIELVGDY